MPPWLSCGFPSHWQIMEVMRPGEKQSPAWQEWPQNGWLNLPWMLLCDWVSMRGWACDHSLTHDWHWTCHSLLLIMLDCICTYNSWDCCTMLWIWLKGTLVYNQQLAFFFSLFLHSCFKGFILMTSDCVFFGLLSVFLLFIS